jgi:short subunit dehydrogenase-like uncharacterized protein
MSKPYDVVVFGATGFTGRLVVEYLLKTYPLGGDVRWAMGGRSPEKLAAVRDELGAPADTPLVVVDSGEAASVQALMSATRLVLTTVGPYQKYGNELVAACAASGVDYVDLCGEPVWMRHMIDAHEAAAKASGARIVFSCGFDSIPSDLGVLLLQKEFGERFGHPASRVRTRVRAMKGTFSGGTAASFQATMAAAGRDPAVMALLRDPFALTPGFVGAAQPSGAKPCYDEVLGQWATPFMMAAINTRNVHRSNLLMGHPYGVDFVYDEMVQTGPGDKGEAIANAMAEKKSIPDKDSPDAIKPGEGPSKEERETGFFDFLVHGMDAQGNQLRVTVYGDRDPGYGSTSKMISEAALSLLESSVAGGILTTAPAMGHALIARLQAKAGLRFAVES